jgi:hypothetical protein
VGALLCQLPRSWRLNSRAGSGEGSKDSAGKEWEAGGLAGGQTGVLVRRPLWAACLPAGRALSSRASGQACRAWLVSGFAGSAGK